MTARADYQTLAGHALAGFQLLEASLKEYLAAYHDKVRKSIPLGMVYEYSGEDFREAALGKLVESFNKTNGNKALVQDIRRLKSKRDHLAHSALVKLFGPEAPDEQQLLRVQALELLDLTVALDKLLARVNGELIRLVGEPVTDKNHKTTRAG